MAGRGNPSFLKNQKAQRRVAKANAKRAARLARNAEKAARRAAGVNGPEVIEPTDGDIAADEGRPAEGGAQPEE